MLRFKRLRRRRRQSLQLPVSAPAPGQTAQIRAALQAKLRVGSADNQYEREADATADRVMAMQAVQHAAVAEATPQRKCAECEEEELQGKPGNASPLEQLQRQSQEEEEEEELQTKLQSGVPEGQLLRQVEEEELLQPKRRSDAQDRILLRQPIEEEEEELQTKLQSGVPQGQLLRQPEEEEEEEEIQTKSRGGATALPMDLADRIDRRQGRGAPLPDTERSFFEPRFGADFSRVRVHADSEAADLSGAINARAFTLGRDIYFNRGEYRPGDSGGRHLMAHELTHTLQQGASASQDVRRRVQGARVSCDSYPRTYPIFGVIGTDDPTGTIQTAVTRALALLDDAIGTLQYGRDRIVSGAPTGWPTISDTVGVSLRERLLIDPDSEASWTGRGPRTVFQAIRWYTNIRRILASDHMAYTCIDSDCDPGDLAGAFAGESRIYLCRPWWHEGLDAQAITLIHEASHIYYDTEDSGRGMGSAYCLENFICDIKDLNACEGC